MIAYEYKNISYSTYKQRKENISSICNWSYVNTCTYACFWDVAINEIEILAYQGRMHRNERNVKSSSVKRDIYGSARKQTVCLNRIYVVPDILIL